ncbi:MAG: alpha/beta hydrolase [Acidimicrobiales bacterium]
MPFIEINGLDCYYERYGAGPPLLNISGSGGDLRRAKPARSPLNKHFDVVHYDQRGLGQTSKPPGPYSMDEYADDAAALIAAMGWRSANIVGTSFGGMVALNLAIRHGEVIDRLVLNCTSPGGPLPSFPLHELEKLDTEAAIEVKLGLLDSRWNPGADDPIPGLGPFYDLMIERMRAIPEPEAARGSMLQLLARADHDVSTRLDRVTAPTLVCAGEFDDQAPLQNSIALVEGIPDARLRVFQGGHLFLIQDRTAFATITAFLEGDPLFEAAGADPPADDS